MLCYQGSKSSIGKWVREFIPNNMTTYVEPFGGMFKVYFNLHLESYSNLSRIVYNDFNPVNSNIFKCVKENHQRLLEEVKLIPYPRKNDFQKGEKSNWIYESNYYQFQHEVFNSTYDLSLPEYRLAARYSYLLSQTFNGQDPQNSTFLDPKNNYRSKFPAFIAKLKSPVYHNYFGRITDVHNLDFSQVIDQYDSPTTLIYLDPPYKDREHFYSNHNFNINSHKRLVDQLKTLSGKWILSYYFFEELLEWLPLDRYQWYSKTFWRPAAGIQGATGEELLILNYEPEEVPNGTNCISNIAQCGVAA